MSLIEREAELEARRRAASEATFKHTGASIPGTTINWRAEALALEEQLAGAVKDRDRAWQTINEIEKALTDHGIAITAPLVDAILPLLPRGQS